MRGTVVVFGLIAGAILAGGMLVGMPLSDHGVRGMVIGYTTMVIAFLLVYFGIRSYRDNVGGGSVSFGRAFAIGMLITLVASLCYVAMWEFLYFGTHTMDGLADKMQLPPWYENPFFNAAVTLLEPLPVGLIMSLVSAGILRRRERMLPA